MAYLDANDFLTIAGEDSESGCDQIHTDFLQHFKNEIRISGMGNTADDVVATELEKTSSVNHDEEPTDGLYKAQKVRRDSTACDSVPQSDESKLFDAGGGGGDGGGSDNNGCFVSGTASSNAGANLFVFGRMTTSTSEKSDEGTPAGIKGRSASKHGAIGKVYKKTREPPLNTSFPSKLGSYELKILKQPEEQHRARYLTEGSRGTVKDQTGQGHPTVKLCGYDQPVPLQVFVGTDVGRMKPHGFYQACKVSNKNSTACVERDIEGTTVIEIMFDPKQEMVAVIDCVGILKLRNADVELRIGLAKSKKKSTCARLIFRVNIPKPDGTFHTLQSASSPIICTQPTGAPEISKKSISQCSVKGGEEMFIIGKNFTKGTVVYFEEVKNDQVTWSKEADIDQDFFQATHLVCTVPSYRLLDTKHPVQVHIVVHSSGRNSDPVCFTYLPGVKTAMLPPAESSIPMETEPASAAKNTMKEVSGLKRPYDLSPHSDASYIRSPGEMTTDMSHLLGHGSAAAASTEFCDKEFTDSKIIQHPDPGQLLSTQPVLEAACVIPVMDHLAKSPVDSFILPLATVDANPGSSVDGISCFQDSKEAAPFMGVYDGMYNSSVASNLVGEALSPRSHGDLELTVNQLSNLLEAAHQESIRQTTTLRRASLSEQIGVVQSPPDRIAPLLDAVPAGPMEFGEPHSKPLTSYQGTRMEDIIMQLINADSERQEMKPKDEMNWSGVPDGDRSFHLTTNSNVASLTGTESHSSCHGSTPSQMENISSFALKTFEPVQPSSSSVQTPPVLFNFDHSVMQSSFLHSQTAEVKPNPSFTGMDDFLSGNIRYTNSSSPQSMDTSCAAGMYSDNNHVGLTFTVPSVDHKDDKSLFSTPLESGSPKDPDALNKFLIHGRSSLPGMSSDGNSALGSDGSRVNMISDNCDMVGIDFRNIDRAGFDAMKTGCTELQNMIDTHLANEVHDMSSVCGQNMILNHSSVNNSEISLLGVSKMSDSEHHLDHIKQNLHSFSGQDHQSPLSSQQLFNQSTHSFSDGNKISEYIGLELPELDALMCLNATRPSAASSMTSLNDVQMPSTHNQEPIVITPGNCITELNHGNSHTTQVHALGNSNPLGNVVSTDSSLSTDNGSMQSNLQQSLSELHDLKQQMGFGESQSPTRSGKMSVTQADVGIIQESNLSPKAEFSISNEQPALTTSAGPVLMLLTKQDSMQSLCNHHDAGNFCISEIAGIQAQMDCPQVTSTGDDSYIRTDSGMSHDTKTLLQPVAQPLLSQPNSIPVAQSLHSQSTPVHVLLQTQDGKQIMIPVTSIMVPPSTTKPVLPVAKQNLTLEPGSSMPATVTLMDYLVSALTRKSDSGLVELSTKQVVMVPAGSLNQSGSPVLQVPTECLTANTPSRQSSSVDGLYSGAITNGNLGNMKFVSALTTVLPQSRDSSTLPVQSRQDHHQPMDTSSPFSHFAQESSGSVAETRLRPGDQQQNNSSCKVPTLLYQLLTTDDSSRALRGPVMTVTMTGLPNLNVDEVSQVLEMNRKQQGLK